MRFGSLVYPDFFLFEKVSAHCLDCDSEREPLVGRAVINAASADFPIAQIEGELVNLCGDHHFDFHSHPGEHQHAVFQVMIGDRKLGITNSVSSMTNFVIFRIEDQNLSREFAAKHRELALAFKRFWSIK